MPIQHKFCMLFSVIIFLWKHLNSSPNAFFYCNSQNLEDVSRAYAHRMMYSERSRLSIFIIGWSTLEGRQSRGGHTRSKALVLKRSLVSQGDFFLALTCLIINMDIYIVYWKICYNIMDKSFDNRINQKVWGSIGVRMP